MQRSKAAPPGARVPFLVLLAALAAGAVIVLQVHRSRAAAERGSRPLVAAPAQASAGGHQTAAP